MKVRYRIVDSILNELKEKYPALMKPPVRIKSLIKKLNITCSEEEFGNSLSGVAMVEKNRKLISVNKAHSKHRRRFTMAHELGHILLHEDQSLSVDVRPVAFLRDDSSSTGQDWREVEANYFAASLLMPKEEVESRLRKLCPSTDDEDELIKLLAKGFGVSPQAMGVRLGVLGITIFND